MIFTLAGCNQENQGRYQIEAAGTSTGGVYRLDTKTGEVLYGSPYGSGENKVVLPAAAN